MNKTFKLRKEDIKRLIPNIGAAFASDKITVKGNKVDYMVREETSRDDDSGWVFYGGGETQEYLDDPKNVSIFEVNTIANYDPDIIEFLTYPPGTEIERSPNGKLEVINKNIPKPDVIFFYPADEGLVQLTPQWSIETNKFLLRRFDRGSLVLWRPEFTIWLTTYNSDFSVEERAKNIKAIKSSESFNFEEQNISDLKILSYQLVEDDQASYYIFGFCKQHDIHMSIYYDNNNFLEDINKIKTSLRFTET